jgi:hypothetical protein
MSSLQTYSPSPYSWVPPAVRVYQTIPGQPFSTFGNSLRGIGALSTAEYYARRFGVPGFSGLGAAITAGATATVSILVALGAVAGPVGAAIAGLVALASKIASLFGGCGQTCVISSDDANQVGDYMTQNLNTYLAAPVHYASLQSAALNNFDTAWASLVAACSNPQLGTAGKNCISERQEGACFWKASPGGWSQANGKWTYTGYGPAGSGSACWNYFVGMRDPIAQDPTVVPDPVASSAASTGGSGSTASTGSAATGSSPDLAPLLVIGGLIGLALLL